MNLQHFDNVMENESFFIEINIFNAKERGGIEIPAAETADFQEVLEQLNSWLENEE